MMLGRWAAISVASVLVLFGCRRGERGPSQAPPQAAASTVAGVLALQPATAHAEPPAAASYFPFRVRLQGHPAFRALTLKDVGLRRGVRGADDPLLETIVESLANALRADAGLALRASVEHDPALLDPRSHVACQGHHLYVDLWRAGATRWGYSLWSGCDHADRFAWQELDGPTIDRTDLTRSVEPLTRSIVSSLRTAKARGCYRRSC